MKRFLSMLLCATILVLVSAAANMSYEEACVRRTYAKVGYAVTLATVHAVLYEGAKTHTEPTRALLDSRVGEDEVRFELSNVSTGSVADIGNRNYAAMVTKPDGTDVLLVSPGLYTYTDDTQKVEEVNARARWETGQDMKGADWNVSVSQVLAQVENSKWYTRFAAYTVKVTFQGKSCTYRAMFLFGRNDKGDEEVLPLDNFTNNSALQFLTKASVYPATLLETKLRAKRAISSWLKANQMVDVGCESRKRAVCCNPTTLKCGVAAEDVEYALNK